jgi:hypothetical protein
MSSNFFKKVGIPIGALAGILLVSNVVTSRAQADQWDKMTLLTFNEPTQVSNTYLEPGTYMFKLANSESDRHIVQIFNRDRSHLYNTILAIPSYRAFPASSTEITFWETPPGSAKAVRVWTYPGYNYGQEFPYPTQLRQVAVVTPPAPAPAPAPEPPPPAVQPETPAPQAAVGQPAPAEQPPVEIAQNTPPQQTAPQAEQPPVEVAQNNPPPPPPASPPDNSQPLPQTASPYPLFGLGGLFALGLYAALRLKAVA